MATHSSILAWDIAWTEEPDGLQSHVSSLLHWQAGSSQLALPGKSYCEVNTKLKIELIKTMQIEYYYIIVLLPTDRTTMHSSDAVSILQLLFAPEIFLFALYRRR